MILRPCLYVIKAKYWDISVICINIPVTILCANMQLVRKKKKKIIISLEALITMLFNANFNYFDAPGITDLAQHLHVEPQDMEKIAQCTGLSERRWDKNI